VDICSAQVGQVLILVKGLLPAGEKLQTYLYSQTQCVDIVILWGVPTSLCLELESLDVGRRQAVGAKVLADFGRVGGVVVAGAGGTSVDVNWRRGVLN
jgi:hypothetical protein